MLGSGAMKTIKTLIFLLMLFSFAGFLSAGIASGSSEDEDIYFLDLGAGALFGVNNLLPIEEEGFVDVANRVAMFHLKMGGIKAIKGPSSHKVSYNWRIEGNPFKYLYITEINLGYWFSDKMYVSTGVGLISKWFSYADEDYPKRKYQSRFLGSLYLNIKLASLQIKPLLPEIETEVWLEAGARTTFKGIGFPVCLVLRFTQSRN